MIERKRIDDIVYKIPGAVFCSTGPGRTSSAYIIKDFICKKTKELEKIECKIRSFNEAGNEK